MRVNSPHAEHESFMCIERPTQRPLASRLPVQRTFFQRVNIGEHQHPGEHEDEQARCDSHGGIL